MRNLAFLALLASGCAARERASAPAEPPVTRTYALRAADSLAEPAPLAAVMRDYFDVRLLIQASGSAGGPARLDVASLDPESEAQDLCAPTSTFEGLTLGEGGRIALQGQALAFTAEGVAVTLTGVSMRATAGEGAFVAEEITAVLDTAQLTGLLGAGQPPDSVCRLLGRVVPCAPCPAGGATCWDITLREARAERVSEPLTPRSREAVCGDPACAGAPACR